MTATAAGAQEPGTVVRADKRVQERSYGFIVVSPHLYVEVAGGDHSLFVSGNRHQLSKVFSFFNIVRRKTP